MSYGGEVMVLGNAGTALIWAGALHFLVGNFLIGLGEAWILRQWFGGERWRSGALMILANYFSMLIGLVFVVSYVAGRLEVDLYNLWRVHLMLYGLAFLVTLVLEWPFVYGALKPQPGRLKRSVVASLVVQTSSNLLVLLWYSLATATPQTQGWTLVRPDQLSLPEGVVMYYISEKDGDVYRMRGGRPGEKVMELGSKSWLDRLFFAAEQGSQVAELRVSEGKLAERIQLPTEATVVGAKADIGHMGDSWMAWGPVPRLGRREDEPGAYTAFWPDRGLNIHGVGGFAVNLPYVRWEARNAIELPDGQFVVQLGENQICLVDPKTKAAGVLVRGRGPAVALDVREATTGPATQPTEK